MPSPDYPKPKEYNLLQEIEGIQSHFYIDEMPVELVTPSIPDYLHYKCRKVFFTTINNFVSHVVKNSPAYQDQGIKRMCDGYENFMVLSIRKKNNTPGNWITREEINFAVNFLNSIKARLIQLL